MNIRECIGDRATVATQVCKKAYMGLLSCFGFEEGVARVAQDLLAGGLHHQLESKCIAWPCDNKLCSINSLRRSSQVDHAHKIYLQHE